jgi:HPt (histidine-containing phosphotransfer) domain-containing protein
MDAAPIDRSVFSELQQTTGADFVGELVETFAEEAPAMVAELRAAVAVQAAERFRRAAHSLKTNAQTFGARRLAEQARALELSGLPADGTLVEEAAAELERSLAALRELAHG